MAEPLRTGPVLATDLDGTMAHGGAAARARLMDALRAEGDLTLIYVTGRSPAAVASLIAVTPLPEPDVLIADVGTSVLRGLGPERLVEVESVLDELWPGGDPVRDRLRELESLSEQAVRSPRRVSYWIEPVRRGGRDTVTGRDALADGDAPAGGSTHAGGNGHPANVDPFHARAPGDPTLGAEAEAVARDVAAQAVEKLEGLEVDVVVSANVFLDVLPRGVDKGSTLRRVLDWMGVPAASCVVAGDSLNDLALFETGIRGIAVGNCEPGLRRRVAALESVYQAAGEGVEGILEGLRYHGVVPTESPRSLRGPETTRTPERNGSHEGGGGNGE